MATAIQIWNPDDWEFFALRLLQSWHGALNVHKIPAAHKGDFGIDYYCPKDAVAYQCYAVTEPIDMANRAVKQKGKITEDLGKLQANHKKVGKLFLGALIKHWVLVVPLHDSKELNLHCAKKTMDLRNSVCVALDPAFEVTVRDLSTFPPETVANGLAAMSKVTLSIESPSQSELDSWYAGSPDLLTNATHKLKKRATPEKLNELVAEAARSFLEGNALLDKLRSSSPELHDRVMAVIRSRTRLLKFAGPHPANTAGEVLRVELEALVSAMQSSAPSLSTENAEQIAYGTICEWIMRCPLDFPNVQ